MISPRHWYLGVALLVAAVLCHALIPRYEWRAGPHETMLRIDRWTGHSRALTLGDLRAEP